MMLVSENSEDWLMAEKVRLIFNLCKGSFLKHTSLKDKVWNKQKLHNQ